MSRHRAAWRCSSSTARAASATRAASASRPTSDACTTSNEAATRNSVADCTHQISASASRSAGSSAASSSCASGSGRAVALPPPSPRRRERDHGGLVWPGTAAQQRGERLRSSGRHQYTWSLCTTRDFCTELALLVVAQPTSAHDRASATIARTASGGGGRSLAATSEGVAGSEGAAASAGEAVWLWPAWVGRRGGGGRVVRGRRAALDEGDARQDEGVEEFVFHERSPETTSPRDRAGHLPQGRT
jgi:hypothetical protein